MSESKKRICKYPKCQKEIPGEKGIFCSHHKKSVKENGEAVGKGALAVVGTLGVILLAAIDKKD
ncbi:hypothetical protein [Vagococcus fluvialis]|uniref:hypothetical protein n=1 Tax=Vagococcus fluvialis TaxID=2738 RepID=UPI001D0BE174|nr:hypothetical protein [Vagococcus fluvialis]UDM71756.1 hypothetical protein K5L00_03080 [Vagococcus fluvialis]UDM76621.1 hypothetical protein K5K98_12875 [Vagococcus fluvialis]UDM83450.1 hypothetical protein K5K96_05555 [Vagococcus fluvialis]